MSFGSIRYIVACVALTLVLMPTYVHETMNIPQLADLRYEISRERLWHTKWRLSTSARRQFDCNSIWDGLGSQAISKNFHPKMDEPLYIMKNRVFRLVNVTRHFHDKNSTSRMREDANSAPDPLSAVGARLRYPCSTRFDLTVLASRALLLSVNRQISICRKPAWSSIDYRNHTGMVSCAWTLFHKMVVLARKRPTLSCSLCPALWVSSRPSALSALSPIQWIKLDARRQSLMLR